MFDLLRPASTPTADEGSLAFRDLPNSIGVLAEGTEISDDTLLLALQRLSANTVATNAVYENDVVHGAVFRLIDG